MGGFNHKLLEGSTRVRRVCLLAVATAGVLGAAGPSPISPDLLADVAGWEAGQAGVRYDERTGGLVLREYQAGPKHAIVVLFMGTGASRVADMMTSMPVERFVAPMPQDRWTERGYRLWATERDGELLEIGVVLRSGGADHPERSAYVSESGQALSRADGLVLLHGLDWDRIRDLAAR